MPVCVCDNSFVIHVACVHVLHFSGSLLETKQPPTATPAGNHFMVPSQSNRPQATIQWVPQCNPTLIAGFVQSGITFGLVMLVSFLDCLSFIDLGFCVIV